MFIFWLFNVTLNYICCLNDIPIRQFHSKISKKKKKTTKGFLFHRELYRSRKLHFNFSLIKKKYVLCLLAIFFYLTEVFNLYFKLTWLITMVLTNICLETAFYQYWKYRWKNLKPAVQLLSHVWFSVTWWTTGRQDSLSITSSRSLLKLMSIESVMPSNHLILSRPLHLLPSIFPSIRVFSKESVFRMRRSNLELQLQQYASLDLYKNNDFHIAKSN